MKKDYNEIDYQIDYDLFKVEEIVKIINFFKLIERNKHHKISKEELINSYNEYRNILNNKSLEKQYDKMLQKQIGVSIYQTMKDLK
ncbi:MAG: UPF0223 family protein [Bacilli bacterium]|nr:UPF0223 family protein [Bacilli bacterium]